MSKIQRQDIKTETDLTNAGAPISSLPGDDQVYVAANSINKTLRQAIIDGDIGGGAGGINYIINGSALANTNGWATYADADQSRPVDGTGGSPNVTWTRGTNTPLRGSGEFLFTKDGANRRGQGASYDFTIDRADQAKPLQIQFDWRLVSGVFAGSTTPATDSDVIVYIFDVTNNVLIEPAGRLLEPAIAGQFYRYRSTFQTSPNSTSYRLIFHVATTTNQAFTLGFDDIRVGPQVVPNGAVVTDFQNYTPTFTNLGTPTAVNVRWRRNGNLLELVGSWTNGTVGAGAATFTLPDGLVSSLNATTVVGNYGHQGTATGSAIVYNNSNNTLFFGMNNWQVQATGTQMATNGFTSFTASLPIQGWSSNVQVSSDTDTRVVSFVGTQASQAVTAGVTNLTLGANKDSHAAWNGTQYIVPVSGDYNVDASFVLAGGGTGQVFLNGNPQFFLSSTTSGQAGAGSGILPNLRAGDSISFRFTTSTTITNGYASISRISGPSQIAASETVSVVAINGSGQTLLNNTVTALTGWTKLQDSHNAFNASTGVFTPPVSGTYRISGYLTTAGGANNATAEFNMLVDSSRRVAVHFVGTAHSSFVSCSGSADFPLVAGQAITIQGYHTLGSTKNLFASTNYNSLSITRVGN
jgi:hypothetical protein